MLGETFEVLKSRYRPSTGDEGLHGASGVSPNRHRLGVGEAFIATPGRRGSLTAAPAGASRPGVRDDQGQQGRDRRSTRPPRRSPATDGAEGGP